jgi:hypothetical protein
MFKRCVRILASVIEDRWVMGGDGVGGGCRDGSSDRYLASRE